MLYFISSLAQKHLSPQLRFLYYVLGLQIRTNQNQNGTDCPTLPDQLQLPSGYAFSVEEYVWIASGCPKKAN